MKLSSLLQNVYSDLGQTPANYGNFLATGGSATTFVNSDWADLESPPETDAFKNMIAFIVSDTVGASPEGKYRRITAYSDTTYTATIATVTDEIASGDSIMIVKQDLFPLQEVIIRINRALSNLGTIPVTNTSITTTEDSIYDLPVALKLRDPISVWYGDATQWYPVSQYKIESATAGSVGKIEVNVPSGQTLKIIYNGLHPVVNAYDSIIHEVIHPKVATAASVLEVLSWYNRRDENQGSNEFFLWLEGEYRSNYLPMALLENPIWKPNKAPRYSTFGEITNVQS